MGMRRVSSILSGSIVMVAGGPGARARDGGWPGDDGGVGGLSHSVGGGGGSSWLVASPTPALQYCLAETVAEGGVCAGEDGGVSSSCRVVKDTRGMNSCTCNRDRKIDGCGVSVDAAGCSKTASTGDGVGSSPTLGLQCFLAVTIARSEVDSGGGTEAAEVVDVGAGRTASGGEGSGVAIPVRSDGDSSSSSGSHI